MLVVDEGDGSESFGRSADTFLSKWSESEHHASTVDSKGHLRGFIATQPILISVEGIESLQKRLESCELSLQKFQETGGIGIKQEEDDDDDDNDNDDDKMSKNGENGEHRLST